MLICSKDQTKTSFSQNLNFETHKISALFVLPDTIFNRCEDVFTIARENTSGRFLNFVLAQAKMAVCVSRKRKVEEELNVDVVHLFEKMVKSRFIIDFSFYRATHDLESFRLMWGHRESLLRHRPTAGLWTC